MAQIWLGRTLNESDQDESVEYTPGQFPKFNTKRSHAFYCIAADLDDQESDILANPNCPTLGSVGELGAPIKTRKATEIDRVVHPVTGAPTILWKVEVSSDSSLNFAFPGGIAVTPETKRPIIKWTTAEEEVVFNYDMRTGYAVTNSVFEPIFDTRKIVYPILHYTRYESYYLDVPALQRAYALTNNAAVFLGFPIDSCLMLPIEVEEEEFEVDDFTTVIYNKVTYHIECKVNDYYANNHPYTAKYLNEGYYYRPAVGQKPVINAPDGHKTKVNLELDGTIVPDGVDPIWLEYDKYKSANWDGLNIVLPVDPSP